MEITEQEVENIICNNDSQRVLFRKVMQEIYKRGMVDGINKQQEAEKEIKKKESKKKNA